MPAFKIDQTLVRDYLTSNGCDARKLASLVSGTAISGCKSLRIGRGIVKYSSVSTAKIGNISGHRRPVDTPQKEHYRTAEPACER